MVNVGKFVGYGRFYSWDVLRLEVVWYLVEFGDVEKIILEFGNKKLFKLVLEWFLYIFFVFEFLRKKRK